MRIRPLSIGLLLLVGGLVAAACGGSNSPEASKESTSTPTGGTQPAATAAGKASPTAAAKGSPQPAPTVPENLCALVPPEALKALGVGATPGRFQGSGPAGQCRWQDGPADNPIVVTIMLEAAPPEAIPVLARSITTMNRGTGKAVTGLGEAAASFFFASRRDGTPEFGDQAVVRVAVAKGFHVIISYSAVNARDREADVIAFARAVIPKL